METYARLEASASVKLDGSGNGIVRLFPANANERWQIQQTSVRQQGNNVIPPKFFSYVGEPTQNQSIDSTYNGNQDDSNTIIDIPYGSYYSGQWVSGDANATMTVVLRGTRFQNR